MRVMATLFLDSRGLSKNFFRIRPRQFFNAQQMFHVRIAFGKLPERQSISQIMQMRHSLFLCPVGRTPEIPSRRGAMRPPALAIHENLLRRRKIAFLVSETEAH